MKPLPDGQSLQPRRRVALRATGYTVGPLAVVATILESPSTLLTALVLILGVTLSLLSFVSFIVFAPTDNPAERLCWLLERLCWLLTAVRGR